MMSIEVGSIFKPGTRDRVVVLLATAPCPEPLLAPPVPDVNHPDAVVNPRVCSQHVQRVVPGAGLDV